MTVAPAGRVVVVGAGVIGLATAFELACSGAECVVVDPAPGRGASWAAGGMLSPASEVAPGEAPLVSDLRAAARCWPSFAARVQEASGIGVDYAATGTILVGVTRSDARDISRFASQVADAGFEVRPVGADEIAQAEPALAAGLAQCFELPDDHHVDNRLLVDALVEAAKSLGVGIIEDTCERLDRSEDRLRFHLADRGTVDADRAVVAIGAAAPFAGLEGLGAPEVRPVRGITLRLASLPGELLPTRTVRAMVDGVPCYLVPRTDGSLVVGATSEERREPHLARAGGVHQLLDAARRLMPGIDELHLAEIAVGLRPTTEDHVPVVAKLADPRLVVAAGYYRHGILLAPLAGERAASLVTSR